MSVRGRTVLLTRAPGRSAEFAAEVARRGGTVVCVPMIVISGPDSWEACDEAIRNIDRYDALVFTSINAVEMFIERTLTQNMPVDALGRRRVYAVGGRTREELEQHGLRSIMVPGDSSASGLAESLAGPEVNGKRFLHPCGNLRREELSVRLTALGGIVDEVVVYKTGGPDRTAVDAINPLLESGRLDVITFASPSAVHHYAALFGPDRPPVRVAVIGRTTARAAEEIGWVPDIVPERPTMPALLEAIDSFFD